MSYFLILLKEDCVYKFVRTEYPQSRVHAQSHAPLPAPKECLVDSFRVQCGNVYPTLYFILSRKWHRQSEHKKECLTPYMNNNDAAHMLDCQAAKTDQVFVV